MTVEIDAADLPDDSDALARALVTTLDATGTVRRYRATLGPSMLGSEYLIGWRQVEGPEAPRPATPTGDVVESVADHFEDLGHDVFRGVDS